MQTSRNIPVEVLDPATPLTQPLRRVGLGRLLGLNEPTMRLIGIPVIAFVISLFVWLDQSCRDTYAVVLSFSLLATLGHWEGNRQIFFYLKRRYPNYSDTRLRLTLQVTYSLLFLLSYNLFGTWLEFQLAERSHLGFWQLYVRMVGKSFIPTLVVMTMYEAAYTYIEWKENHQRAERLERTSALSQLEALKQQVDPHFLFNSLNTLAALIGENPPAQQFLDQLCDVYRYVLLSKDRPLVPLVEEMAFVESYMYLNKIRHRDNVRFRVEVAPHTGGWVPPLAVQVLVENALKHNAVSADAPLEVEIFQPTPDTLAVRNVRQKRLNLLAGTGQGLPNLMNRYALMTPRPVEIHQNDAHFEVVIPVLDSETLTARQA